MSRENEGRGMYYPNLSSEMANKAMTTADLAEELGLDREELDEALHGERPMDLQTAFGIRDGWFRDCDLEYLFFTGR